MIVKICGLTRLEDALAAGDAGADMLGFVFAESPRRIRPEDAALIIRELPEHVSKVGVFVDEEVRTITEIIRACRLDLVQLHGSETPEYAENLPVSFIKAFRLKDESVLNAIRSFSTQVSLVDSYDRQFNGGTGRKADWLIARKASMLGKIILAGGLTPENVAHAIREVRPYGVDVSSGVESAPGAKSHEKIRAFIAEAKSCRRRNL
ncbi:MAG: phosphoribosylanthranilate isomerase [Planctomycetota bacterium]|jgi:phosphoribosylanthranilate isomerase